MRSIRFVRCDWFFDERVAAHYPLFLILSASGEAYGTCWALWDFNALYLNGRWIGLPFGTFGVCQTLAQTFVPGAATKLLGDRGAVLVGIACACVALVVMAFASQGWIIYAIMPIFALAGVGTPALQTLGACLVDADHQGQFTGVLATA